MARQCLKSLTKGVERFAAEKDYRVAEAADLFNVYVDAHVAFSNVP